MGRTIVLWAFIAAAILVLFLAFAPWADAADLRRLIGEVTVAEFRRDVATLGDPHATWTAQGMIIGSLAAAHTGLSSLVCGESFTVGELAAYLTTRAETNQSMSVAFSIYLLSRRCVLQPWVPPQKTAPKR